MVTNKAYGGYCTHADKRLVPRITREQFRLLYEAGMTINQILRLQQSGGIVPWSSEDSLKNK